MGTEVIVPFGRGNREISGYIVGFSEEVDYDPRKIKPILGKAQGKTAIESKLVALAAWMKENYGGTMIQALKTVLPVKRQERVKNQRTVELLLSRRRRKAEAGSLSPQESAGPGPAACRTLRSAQPALRAGHREASCDRAM